MPADTAAPKLACPFCGHPAAPEADGDYISGWSFRCLSCDAVGPSKPSEAAARDGWDARFPSPREAALVEASK